MFREEELLLDEAEPVSPVISEPRPKPRVVIGKGRALKARKPESVYLAECMRKVAESQDRQAFTVVFEHFAPRVKAYLIKTGANSSAAEECVQEAMVSVWNKAGLFDPRKANVSTWIFTIARNKWIDSIRKQNRPEPDELSWNFESEPNAEDMLVTEQEGRELAVAIANLPEKQLDLIKRAYYGDLSHREIAQQTGLPLGTIKSRIRLALDRLRHELK